MKAFYYKHHAWLNGAIIVIAAFAVFSNNYRHDYPLDCGHLLLENPFVRSLTFIPRYFSDASTLTVLPANTDYRPVLQVTYALNYAISKYDTWSWHLVQILLHCVCALGLYFLCRRLIQEFHPEAGPLPGAAVPLGAALLFAIHPTASGVINYLSARSSLLTAAFLLPSFVLYLRPVYHEEKTRLPLASVVLFTLALFTKIEAIGALPVYLLCDSLYLARQRARQSETGAVRRGGFFRDVAATFNVAALKRLWMFAAVTVFYVACYHHAMRGYHQAARHAADVTSLAYLFTQVTAGWHYLFNWFAPVKLIADDLTFPVFRSPFAPEVMLALAGWVLAAGFLRWLYPRYAYAAFLAVSALALISPTSSVLPLAEMVNEHRPYLPVGMLSLVWLIPFGLFVFRAARRCRPVGVAAGCWFAVLAASFFLLTYQRNSVFASEPAYYLDLIKKAPSSRAYVNYGLTLMRTGRYQEALGHYKKALELAPNWHIIHINMGIAYQHLGDTGLARYHFDRAVATEEYSAYALLYRAEFRLKQKQYGAALDDLQNAVSLSRDYFRLYKSMACAYAGLGNGEKSLEYARRCHDLDLQGTEVEIVGISQPFWEDPARYKAGIQFFKGIDAMYPRRWWVFQNIGDLANKMGLAELAQQSFEEARRLRQTEAANPRK